VKNLSELGALMNIKLKISSDSEKFLTLAKQLSHYCTANPLLKFRLDANQSLSTQELEQYFSIIEELDLVTHLDYFEEPLKNHLDYLGLKANIPYALEESLDQYLKDKKHYKPQALVYKPSQQGLSKLSKLLKGEDREKVVISSCFDPLYAYEATTLLAREFPSKAHGLGAKTREEDISLSKKKALL
jgi:O-succinylbenzoate synthase